jgi:hypothetical protein
MSRKSKSLELAKEVAELICNGLLQSPELLSELPPFLVALESGREVDLGRISSEKGRETVEKLYELIPKLSSGYNLDLKSIRQTLLKSMLDTGCIVQPNRLSSSEAQATKSAPVLLLDLVSRFPTLKLELGGLFRSVLAQEKDYRGGGADSVIDLSGIGDEDVAESVGKVLVALGLVEVGFDDHRFEFPTIGSGKRSDCINAMKHFSSVFRSYERFCGPPGVDDGEEPSASSCKRHKSSHGSDRARQKVDVDGGNESGDSGSDSNGDKRPAPSSIGPAMPSAAQLRSAQLAAAEVDSESSDDDYGPRMHARDGAGSTLRPRTGIGGALGGEGYSSESENAPVPAAPVVTEVSIDADGKPAREEWMMVPGEHDLFGGAVNRGKASLFCPSCSIVLTFFYCCVVFSAGDAASVLVNKGFQTGKLAKKAAEAVEAFKEESQKEYEREHSEEHAAAQALMEEYRLARGPSLMEAHLEKVKAGRHKPKRTHGLEKQDRRSFSRDDDVLPRAKLTARDANEMVKDAKQLDSRFSKGTVQKSF